MGPATELVSGSRKTATKCEEPVKIGFVLLPGTSRRTHASSFLIMPYIVEILALFGIVPRVAFAGQFDLTLGKVLPGTS